MNKQEEAGNNQPTERSYTDFVEDVLAGLRERHVAGAELDLGTVLATLDFTKDNRAIEAWLQTFADMTKAQVQKALNRARRQQRIRTRLGFIPTDAQNFVGEHIRNQLIEVAYDGTLRRRGPVKLFGSLATPHDRQDRLVDYVCRVAENCTDNLADLARELRLINAELDLGYQNSTIGDALDEHVNVLRKERKREILGGVAYGGRHQREQWARFEAAAFDVGGTAPGYASAVIRNFMWQVKCKAIGAQVTRHMMPVITGPQGRGKSVFVHSMTEPLRELTRPVDFKQIEEQRIIDIWHSSILVLDEMSHAARSDIDVVKNVITATTITRRPMGQNNTVPVKQNATLIGTSNKSLPELIRDDTGLRRFAELVWRRDPDFSVLNSIVWRDMWQSVDETAADPMDEFRDLLTAQQEAARDMTPVEMWAREQGSKYTDWHAASKLHELFRQWEESRFPARPTGLKQFGLTLTGLIKNRGDFQWSKREARAGFQYRFEG